MVQQVRLRTPRNIRAIRLNSSNMIEATEMVGKDGFIYSATNRFSTEHISFSNASGSYLDSIKVHFGDWIVYDGRIIDVLTNVNFHAMYEVISEPTDSIVAVTQK